MTARPGTLTAATILLLILSLSNFPWPWMVLFPGAEEAPDWVIYSGIVLAVAGLICTYGLWQRARWSYWPSIVVSVLNIIAAAPGLTEAPSTAIKIALVVTIIVAVAIVVLLLRREAKESFASPGGAHA